MVGIDVEVFSFSHSSDSNCGRIPDRKMPKGMKWKFRFFVVLFSDDTRRSILPIFNQLGMGYNKGMRTRVKTHPQNNSGTYNLQIRETLQFNVDPFDITEVLTIEARQQQVYRSRGFLRSHRRGAIAEDDRLRTRQRAI